MKTILAFRIGEVIPITVRDGRQSIACHGRVEHIDGTVIHFTYTDDSPIFAGLRGILRANRHGLKWVA